MKTDTRIFNRLDAPANFAWMHVCPLGEHRFHFDPEDKEQWLDGHKEIIQVIDREACEAMAASYPLSEPDRRIDIDHESLDQDKRTAAVGWGKRAEVRADGLWVEVEWNPEGHELIANKVYRFNSPVFERHGLSKLKGNRYRVTKLGCIALTNDPNLRGQTPLTNSRHKHAREGTAIPNQKTKTNMDYKAELLKLLGLPAEATDEEITAALGTTGGETVTELVETVAELEEELTGSDLDNRGITDPAQRKLFTPLLANRATRADALKTLDQISAKAKAAAPIHNRRGAKTPDTVTKLAQAEGKDAEDKSTNDLHNRARKYRDTHKVRYEHALNAVRADQD